MSYCRSKHYALFRDKNAKCKHTPTPPARSLRTWLECETPPTWRDSVLKSRDETVTHITRTSKSPRHALSRSSLATAFVPTTRAFPLMERTLFRIRQNSKASSQFKNSSSMCLIKGFRKRPLTFDRRWVGRNRNGILPLKCAVLRFKSGVLRWLCNIK